MRLELMLALANKFPFKIMTRLNANVFCIVTLSLAEFNKKKKKNTFLAKM